VERSRPAAFALICMHEHDLLHSAPQLGLPLLLLYSASNVWDLLVPSSPHGRACTRDTVFPPSTIEVGPPVRLWPRRRD